MAIDARDIKGDAKADKDEMIAQLTGQIEELKAQMGDLMRSAKHQGKDVVHEVAEASEGLLKDAKCHARKAFKAAGETAEEWRENAAGYVHDADKLIRQNPATAVGVAVGVGLLVGALIARK